MFSIFVHNFSCSAIYSAQIVSFWCNKIENFIAGGIIDGEGTKGFREEDVGAGARETIGAGAGAAPARWAPMPCTSAIFQPVFQFASVAREGCLLPTQN